MASPQNHAGIFYARYNSANLATARTNTGGTVGSYTEIIDAPVPITGPITITTGSTAVTNGGTDFTSDMVGKYIWGFDLSGEPVLGGQILSFGSTSALTLTANGSSAITARPFGVSYTLITTNESIIMGMPVAPQDASSVWIPVITAMRNSPGNLATTYNNPAVTQLQRYSDAGTPLVIDGTPENISFTIEPLNIFQTGNPTAGGCSTFWLDSDSLPQTITVLLNPYGSTGQNLAAKTLYRWKTQELLSSELVSPGTVKSFVVGLGYNNA